MQKRVISYTMVGLTNDERCSIHNLRVEKKLWFLQNYENIFKLMCTFKL